MLITRIVKRSEPFNPWLAMADSNNNPEKEMNVFTLEGPR